MLKNGTDIIKIVCFFARSCGVEVLRMLLNNKRFRVVRLFVHNRLPKNEDQNRGIRPEFPIFKQIANQFNIPLTVINTRKESEGTISLDQIGKFDLLLSLSWRFLISKDIFSKASFTAINVHRGKLPDYAGGEPIRKALENNEKNIVITAHEMVERIDAGKIIIEKKYPVNYDESRSLNENVDRLKKEILPIYCEVFIEAIEKITGREYYAS